MRIRLSGCDAHICVGMIAPALLLVPRERFGQFSSANAMISSLGGIAAAAGAGMLMDWLGNCLENNHSLTPRRS